MTSKSIVYALQAQFGGNVVYRPSTNPKWKDQWRWRVTCKKGREVYAQLKPFLRLK